MFAIKKTICTQEEEELTLSSPGSQEQYFQIQDRKFWNHRQHLIHQISEVELKIVQHLSTASESPFR